MFSSDMTRYVLNFLAKPIRLSGFILLFNGVLCGISVSVEMKIAQLGASLAIVLFLGLVIYGSYKLQGFFAGEAVSNIRGEYSRRDCDSKRLNIIFAATKYKGVPMNSAMFFADGCPLIQHTCDITDNIAIAKYAKAVIFHNDDFDRKHYEKLRKAGLPNKIPKIWFSMDAPSNDTVFIPNMTFDYILSYRDDSDFKSPYGYVERFSSTSRGIKMRMVTSSEPKEKKEGLALLFASSSFPEPNECYPQIDTIEDEYMTHDEIMKNISLSKKSTAAWISPTKCNKTESQSYVLMEGIKKAGLEVDVFGDCSEDWMPFNCKEGTLKQKRECKEELIKPYKFYFAFEDTICNDFITEDFFTSLRRWKAVPIVFKREIYEKHSTTIIPWKTGTTTCVPGNPDCALVQYLLKIPSRSFIAIDDFNSIADFVSKINQLNDNDEEYMQYHEWRETARVFPMSNRFTGMCNLCDMIFSLPTPQSHRNIQEWYTKDQCDNTFTESLLRSFKSMDNFNSPENFPLSFNEMNVTNSTTEY